MILTCSNCSTQFFVDGSSFGAAPRKVRCGNCGYAWVQSPMDNDAEVLDRGAATAAAPPRDEPQWDGGRGGVRWAAVFGWFVFVFVVGALVFGAYHYRDRVVAEWPRAAQLYGLAGIEVQSARAYGLELLLDDNEVRRGEENGTPVVFISGHVQNTTGVEKDVPPVRLMLLDRSGTAVQEIVFQIDANVLAPGERAPFEARVANPDPAATEVKLVFDLD